MCIGGLNLRRSQSGSGLVPPNRVLGKHEAVLTVRQGRGEVLQRFFGVKNRFLVRISVQAQRKSFVGSPGADVAARLRASGHRRRSLCQLGSPW